MLRSLLVPLDGSEFSERTLPLARGLARATGATLHLAHVHVSHTPDHFLSNTQFQFEGLDMDEYERRHRREEEVYLADVESRVGGDASVDSALLEGVVADQIAEYAARVGADMVLMTTHGHTGVNRMWLGSVADALVRQTTLPLLIVHPAPGAQVPKDVTSIEHILVPLDGSELSASILEPAANLARAVGARLTLLHVVSATAPLGPRIFPLSATDIEQATERAEERLEATAAELREEGLAVDTHVEAHDVVGRAIADVAERLDADVIALATHGYGGIKRALLGSVADKVLRSSARPLLVKRPD